MHGRMSRLRRSLSRGSLFAGLSRSQLSLVDLPSTPPQQHSVLIGRFSTPTAFPQLKQLVQTNNEALREIISIFDERASLDFAYSKTMQKLSSKLHKISLKSTNPIDRAWTYVADQFDAHASIHSNLGSSIVDDIVQPLRSIYNSQQQTIHATDQLVSRELRLLSTKRDDVAKIKRFLYSSSRELEKVEQLIDNDQMSNIKLSVRKRKLLDQVIKQEHVYVKEAVSAEKQRRVSSAVLRKGVGLLEVVEKQRLAHCQTALGRFQRKVAQLGPNLNRVFECYMTALNDAVSADPNAQISSLRPGGGGTCSANHIIHLCDFHAENFAEVIAGQRRRWALERVSNIVSEQLESSQSEPINPTEASSSSSGANFSFLDYLSYKIGESIKSMDSAQNRTYHILARFQQKIRDKMGLPQTILVIPLEETESAVNQPAAASLPTTSSSEDFDCEQATRLAVDETPSQSTNDDAQRLSGEYDRCDTSKRQQLYRVLYDFTANSADELDVRAGDCVLVEGQIGDDWLVGQVISNTVNNGLATNGERLSASSGPRSGRFPATYVTSANGCT